jgi:hypothetical protein
MSETHGMEERLLRRLLQLRGDVHTLKLLGAVIALMSRTQR